MYFLNSTRTCFIGLISELSFQGLGGGKDEGVVTRIIATRADKDLAFIKEAYRDMFGVELSKTVKVGRNIPFVTLSLRNSIHPLRTIVLDDLDQISPVSVV